MEEYTENISHCGPMGTYVESCSKIPLDEVHLKKIKKIKGLEDLMNNSLEISNYEEHQKRYFNKDCSELLNDAYVRNQLRDIAIDEEHQIAVCLMQNHRKDVCINAGGYDESKMFSIYAFNKEKLQSSDVFTSFLHHWFASREPYEFKETNQDLDKIEISKESEGDRIIVNASIKNDKEVYKILFDNFHGVPSRDIFNEKHAKLIKGEIKDPEYSKIMSIGGHIR